jgi:hypothetical protein
MKISIHLANCSSYTRTKYGSIEFLQSYTERIAIRLLASAACFEARPQWYARSDWPVLARDADRKVPWPYRIPYARYSEPLALLEASTACTAASDALLDLFSWPQIPQLRSLVRFELGILHITRWPR